jgi:UDP-GlcNAc:undecaprenyl-phosphate/decaprenyl-phosphate GlcNAc-1-phosphate transferase
VQDLLIDTYGAFLGFGLAMVIVWGLTPVVGGFARRMGVLDQPAARKIHQVATPRLGGIAIFFGVIVPGLLFLSQEPVVRGILAGAALVTLLGVMDDTRDIPPLAKLAGQLGVALLLVLYGVRVEWITVPGIGVIPLGWVGIPFSVIWVVSFMNIVNFIDGMDGLAAGVCAISAFAFTIIAVSLGQYDMAILAAIVAGATTGFLWHNFHPASIFMGDSGALLLGFLLGAISLQGTLKGVATVALLIPLLVLGIPIFDTGFAIARRVKNRRPIYAADRGHLHHRFTNLGYSQRQTVVILYSWSASMSVLALAMRFAPVWLIAALAVVVGGISVYLAYLLEILRWSKFTRLFGGPAPAPMATAAPPVETAADDRGREWDVAGGDRPALSDERPTESEVSS